MSPRPALRVIDCDGELVDFTTAEEENKALRSALTRLQNAYNALARDKAAERKRYVSDSFLEDAFEDWKAKLVAAGHKGKARCKLSDDRIDAMRGMAEAGYTLEDFRLVNTGIAACPYVVYGRRQQRGAERDVQVDIAWCCEKARRFEEAAKIGYQVEKVRGEVVS
jgi:hypothetical protein